VGGEAASLGQSIQLADSEELCLVVPSRFFPHSPLRSGRIQGREPPRHDSRCRQRRCRSSRGQALSRPRGELSRMTVFPIDDLTRLTPDRSIARWTKPQTQILTGSAAKLSPEQQLERGYASISSAASSLFYQASYSAEHLAASASSYASAQSASAR
jgi:hypothetical protein